MKLPVYLYGHPVLREISEDITPDYPGLKQLVADMFETMYASDGVGLAAPQIGRNDRIVVIDASPVAENFPECDGWKKALINPEIEILDGELLKLFSSYFFFIQPCYDCYEDIQLVLLYFLCMYVSVIIFMECYTR